MMPGLSGTEVCRRLRQRSTVPIIMVTARDAEIDKVVGLELGADGPTSPSRSTTASWWRASRAVLRRGVDTELIPDVIEGSGSAWTSSATRCGWTASPCGWR